jgi:hypothetical protein
MITNNIYLHLLTNGMIVIYVILIHFQLSMKKIMICKKNLGIGKKGGLME